MFSNKMLYIPDYVTSEDIDIIVNYFEDFEIAKVKDVKVYEHPEPEYHAGDTDKYTYGYAIIEIDYYYDNTCARNFYSKIENRNCYIIYDDPFYWELEFSPYHTTSIEETSLFNNHDTTSNEIIDNNSSTYDSENESSSEYYSGDEQDDAKDLDYKYEDEDLDSEEYNYEFSCYKKFDNATKKKLNAKKRKFNDDLIKVRESLDAIKEKQDKLQSLLINKNYMKKNKRKDYKNVWTRRLRQKILD